MLVGQLLALSYLSRLYGPPPGSQPLGKVSAIYIGLFLCVSVVSTLVLPAAALGLSRALVLEELHLWRPITAVFCTDGLGLDFALQLWFFGSFSSLLERRHFHNTPFKYAAALVGGTLLIGLQAFVLEGEAPLALSHSLTLFVVTLWSRTGPLEPISHPGPDPRNPRPRPDPNPNLRPDPNPNLRPCPTDRHPHRHRHLEQVAHRAAQARRPAVLHPHARHARAVVLRRRRLAADWRAARLLQPLRHRSGAAL